MLLRVVGRVQKTGPEPERVSFRLTPDVSYGAVMAPTPERPISTDPSRPEDQVTESSALLWIAARRTDLMHGYKYPRWLIAIGALAWLTTVYLGYMSLTELGQLF
jgi:hypothetical protein